MEIDPKIRAKQLFDLYAGLEFGVLEEYIPNHRQIIVEIAEASIKEIINELPLFTYGHPVLVERRTKYYNAVINELNEFL